MSLHRSILMVLLVINLPLVVCAGTYWVPVVAHTPGVGSTQWRSDVAVLNLCQSTAVVQLRLHTSQGVESKSFTVPGGSQQIFEDVVAQLTASDSIAPLEVLTGTDVTVTSRTYNLAAAGTFGQSLDGVTAADGIGAGEAVYLQQLQETSAVRTNLGVLNMGTGSAEVSVTLYDRNGVVGSFTLELEPAELVQENRPYRTRFGRSDIFTGYAAATVSSGASVYVYASVVDGVTGDPTTFTMKPAPTCESIENGDLIVEVYDAQRAYNGVTLLGQIGVDEPSRIFEVDMLGNIAWELDLPPELASFTGGLEVQSLDNCNILVMYFDHGIYELTRSGDLVWSYPVSKISHDADRLDNGNTVFVYGMGDRMEDAQVTEIDSIGSTVWQWFAADEYASRFPGTEIEGWSHINGVQRLSNGDTLVSLRNFNLTAIVDPSGAVVEEHDWSQLGMTFPHEPVALPNGNLLVCLQNESPYQAVEVARASGSTVWTYAHETPLRTTRDCDRLPNGNTLLVTVKDEGDGLTTIDESTIIEVTPGGDVVWQLTLHGISMDNSPGVFFKAERIGTATD